MPPKHSKASAATATQEAPPADASTSTISLDPAAATSMKLEESDINGTTQGSGQKEEEDRPEGEAEAEAEAGARAEPEQEGSRESTESDEKNGNASPSKKASTKSKKGSKASRNRSASSKRSSEEQVAQEDARANASTASDRNNNEPEGSVESAQNQDNGVDGAKEKSTETDVGQREGSASSEGTSTANGSGKRQRSSSTNKELAQLGLASFGDGAEDGVVGPRRSRRGPGASPDPKNRIPKEEDDPDASMSANDPAPKIEHADEQVQSGDVEITDAEQPSEREAEAPEETEETEYLDGGIEGGDEGVTRCVCGSADENVGLMIQCETCKCWQHCVCMGMQVEEDCPDVYFCEQCRPELHIPLLRSLGLLPKGSKNGKGKGSKYSARELKEAKEAIALLAEENARRTQAAEAAAAGYGSRDRKASGNSKNDAANSKEVPKSPKRRSTMNSRDSAYGGWEPIPPGLLAEGEVWEGSAEAGQEDRKGGGGKKRKRGGLDEFAEGTPETGEDTHDSTVDLAKRRRMSGGAGAGQEEDRDNVGMEEEDEANADHSAAARDRPKKKKGNNQYTNRESSVVADSKPRHPNQYTYRNKDRNTTITANGSKQGSSSTSNLTSHSPSPSPSKNRVEATRRGAAKESGSRTGTPAPAEPGSNTRGGHSNVQWGLPEHLTHLSYLLPLGVNRLGANGTVASGSSKSATGSASNAGKKSNGSSGTPSPPDGTSYPAPFKVISSIESSTKVRFPGRRMTMGEMRKRVRNIGEYVTRSQIEAVEREKRMKHLGIVPPYLEEMDRDETEPEHGEKETNEPDPSARAANGDEGEQTTGEPTSKDSSEEGGKGETSKQDAAVMSGEPSESRQAGQDESASALDCLPISMRLMEELTRELINFQKRFGIGPGSYGSLSSSHTPAAVN